VNREREGSDERAARRQDGPDPAKVRAVELLISRLLRAGVFTSLVFVIAGTVLSFVHHPEYLTSPPALQHLTRSGVAFPRTPRGVIDGLMQLSGQAVIVVGLLILVATPVLRVAVSIVGFIYERDWTFVAITSVVLGLLILSFVLGKAAG
jgi:uncharacterized membrane protein